MAISRNMVSDYGADNTGVASVTSKFYVDLKADVQGEDATVTSPAGTYDFATYGGDSFYDGALDMTLENTGATYQGTYSLGSLHITQIGIDQVAGKSARIQTVTAGALSVTLSDASASAGHISRFSIGQYILVCGWPIQASFQSPYSFPPNWQWHDFRLITDIVGDTIYFDEPLTYYYSADWPEVNRGSAFEVDAAGPASIFALSQGWKGTTTINEGSYTCDNLINCYRENFILNGGVSTNLPVYPSVTRLFRLVDHTATAHYIEHDKLCDLVDIQGGDFAQWKCQSSSTKLLQFDGSTIDSFNGTAGNTVLDDCIVTGGVILGAIAYGRANSFIARNTSFGGTITGGLVEKGPRDEGVDKFITMSGGVMTIPASVGDSATRTLMPKADGSHVLHWWGTEGTFGAFKVLSATSDRWPAVDNQSVSTNVSITSGLKALTTSDSLFTSGDVGKVIAIPGAGGGGSVLYTFITGYTSPTAVTIFDPAATTLSSSTQTIQWGTCNIYVATDQAGGLPNGSLWSNLWLAVPGVRTLRLENCTGTGTAAQQSQIADLTQTAAWNRPLFEYSKRTYDGTTGATDAPEVQLMGYVRSIKVNVTKAYSGASSLDMGFSQFDNMPVATSSAWTTYGPRFDLKALGERVITVGSTTGAQAGDSNLDISVQTWFGRTYQPSMSRDISGESSADWPSFTVEFDLDQGFPAASGQGGRVRIRMR